MRTARIKAQRVEGNTLMKLAGLSVSSTGEKKYLGKKETLCTYVKYIRMNLCLARIICVADGLRNIE